MIRIIPKLILLTISFLMIAGITAYLTVSYLIQNEETVIVPELVGKDIIHVLEVVAGLGLHVRVKGSAYSQDFAQNQIIFQDPKPGEVIKKGRDIKIIISKGTKTLSMPNIKGLNLQQARLIIDKNGLTVGHVSKTYHPHTASDRIISQQPPPGRTVKRGTSADLLVSRGPRPTEFVMPDFIGLYLDVAVLAAEKNHLVIDQVKTIPKPDKPENTVMEQEPPPGTCYVEKQGVSFTVNRKIAPGDHHKSIPDGRKSLFRYRLPPGFLKQHIRVELRAFNTTFTLYDELMQPDREIWIVVPEYAVSVIFLYKNDELILSRIFD